MTLWRRLFRRRKLEQQLDRELAFHFEQQVRDNVKAGMSEDAARREARLTFGPVDEAKEECRDVQRIPLLESTLQDVCYAVRAMRRTWLFSAVVVLSLGLGIGANTAIFTLIDAVMWRMLPVKNPETLLAVGRTENGNPAGGYTYQQFRAMREGARIADLAGYSSQQISVSFDGSLEPTAEVHLISGNYFSFLGVNPIAGRTITVDDDRIPNGHPVAVISYRYWTRRFGRNPDAVGKTISLSGTPFTIVGVTPAEFFGTEVGSAPDFFVPITMQPAVMPVIENLLENPSLYWTWISMLGRLRPGVNAAQAEAILEPLFSQNVPPPKFGGPRPKVKIIMNSAAGGISALRRQFSEPLLLVMGLVGAVLLIACANIANLFLARAAARNGEFAVRLAIGAGRWRLTRQLLAESTVLALFGGAFAILLSQWATRLLLVYLSRGRSPVIVDVTPNLRILAFAAAVSIAAGVLFGLVTALRMTRLNLTPALKHLRISGRLSSSGPRKALAVAQVALSLILLIGAALFVRSLWNLNSHDAGFPREHVLIVRVEPAGSDPRGTGDKLQRLHSTYVHLLEGVQALPGVRWASLANVSPSNPESGCCGFRDPETRRVTLLPHVMVYPRYFQTLGIPIIGGRDFQTAEFEAGAPNLVIINETLAEAQFSGQSPIGKSLGNDTIIGIVRDSRYTSLKEPTQPTAYKPFLKLNSGRGQMILHVRTATDPALIMADVRNLVWKADPTVPQFEIHTLAEEIDAVLVQERLVATLSSVLGGLALLLASIGLYGVLAFAVVQRTPELGIRVALGALRRDIVWMILKEALSVVFLGIALGLPIALGLARVGESRISGFLFGLKTGDPVTLAFAIVVLALVGVMAGYLPALRASRVEPMTALRNE
jgi:predicted permease